jgi:hypothetical protein
LKICRIWAILTIGIDMLREGKGETAVPRRRPAKNWSAATLKSRGWTNALIRELLPPPEYEVTESGRRRIWNKKLVKAAEEHPHFQARRIEPWKTPAQGAGGMTFG